MFDFIRKFLFPSVPMEQIFVNGVIKIKDVDNTTLNKSLTDEYFDSDNEFIIDFDLYKKYVNAIERNSHMDFIEKKIKLLENEHNNDYIDHSSNDITKVIYKTLQNDDIKKNKLQIYKLTKELNNSKEELDEITTIMNEWKEYTEQKLNFIINNKLEELIRIEDLYNLESLIVLFKNYNIPINIITPLQNITDNNVIKILTHFNRIKILFDINEYYSKIRVPIKIHK